jgi:hypothetical protein
MPRKVKTGPVKNMAPAVAAWKEQETRWKQEALAWVRSKLEAWRDTEEAYEPRTAADLMHMLDAAPDVPTGYARIVGSDTKSYRERYAAVRNALEVMARQKLLVMSGTINAKGRENSTTYARPRDATGDWIIHVEGDKKSAERAKAAGRAWLALEGGASLDGVSQLVFIRKPKIGGSFDGSKGTVEKGGGDGEKKSTSDGHSDRDGASARPITDIAAAGVQHRRKRRNTSPGD